MSSELQTDVSSRALTEARRALHEYTRMPEFKRMVNQIVCQQNGQSFRSIAVVSQFGGEGKTFLVSALAMAYAVFLRRKVLIMDTVNQTRNESFYMSRVLGNPEVFADTNGEALPKPTIDLITTKSIYREIKLTQADPSRRVEPGDFENDDDGFYDTADFQIGGFLRALEENYDLILLDTCAISQSKKDNLDPLILARQADTAILVTSEASTDKRTLRSLKNQFRRCQINLLGSVHNNGVANG